VEALLQLRQLLFGLAAALDHLQFGVRTQRNLVEERVVDLDALLRQDLALIVDEARRRRLVQEQATHLLIVGIRDDLHLIALIGEELLLLGVFDVLGALVLLGALARKHLGADDDALHARRHAQRRILHVAGFLAENRAQELLFWRELSLALRGDLADEDIAR